MIDVTIKRKGTRNADYSSKLTIIPNILILLVLARTEATFNLRVVPDINLLPVQVSFDSCNIQQLSEDLFILFDLIFIPGLEYQHTPLQGDKELIRYGI